MVSRVQCLILAYAVLTLGTGIGCSAYQSEARKFLESQAYEYAGVNASSYLLDCQNSWSDTEGRDSDMELNETKIYWMSPSSVRVSLIEQPYSCDYDFQIPERAQAGLESAADLTKALSSTDPRPGRIDNL